jgi:hypothetical protein
MGSATTARASRLPIASIADRDKDGAIGWQCPQPVGSASDIFYRADAFS